MAEVGSSPNTVCTQHQTIEAWRMSMACTARRSGWRATDSAWRPQSFQDRVNPSRRSAVAVNRATAPVAD